VSYHDTTGPQIREWFADVVESGGLAWRGSEANINTLQELDKLLLEGDALPDDPRLRIVVGACATFGHCCPGGSIQANICRSAEEDDEEGEKEKASLSVERGESG